MKHALLLVSILAGCGGTYYPPPTYGTVQQPPPPPDGTLVSSTSTTTFHASVDLVQPAILPMEPLPISSDQRCSRADSPRLCGSLITMLEIGEVLEDAAELPCRRAAAALNRYADDNRGRIADVQDLPRYETVADLQAFQSRHEGEMAIVFGSAVDLHARCDDNRRVGEALVRVGFHGIADQNR